MPCSPPSPVTPASRGLVPSSGFHGFLHAHTYICTQIHTSYIYLNVRSSFKNEMHDESEVFLECLPCCTAHLYCRLVFEHTTWALRATQAIQTPCVTKHCLQHLGPDSRCWMLQTAVFSQCAHSLLLLQKHNGFITEISVSLFFHHHFSARIKLARLCGGQKQTGPISLCLS